MHALWGCRDRERHGLRFLRPACGQPVAATPVAVREILASPIYDHRPTRQGFRRRFVVGVAFGALVAVAGAGLLFSLGHSNSAREVVEAVARAYRDGDCETAAKAFHYETDIDRASEVAICRESGERSRLVTFEVTEVDETPSGVRLPAGADDVVHVHLQSEFLVDGNTRTTEDKVVVAKYDGEWLIVFESTGPQAAAQPSLTEKA